MLVIQSLLSIRKFDWGAQSTKDFQNIGKYILIISTEFSDAAKKFKFQRGDKAHLHTYPHSVLLSMVSTLVHHVICHLNETVRKWNGSQGVETTGINRMNGHHTHGACTTHVINIFVSRFLSFLGRITIT